MRNLNIPLVTALLLLCLFSSCKKDYTVANTNHIESFDITWNTISGIDNSDFHYRFAFVKNNQLYVIGTYDYIIINNQNQIVSRVDYKNPITDEIHGGRYNDEFIVVAGQKNMLIKHLASGNEKVLTITNGSFTDIYGKSGFMLSKFNNLYAGTRLRNQADSVNYAYHLRYTSSGIEIDTLQDLLLNEFHGSGSRFQSFVANAPGYETVLYDDLNKTYTNFDKTYTGQDYSPPFPAIQEVNDTAIIVTENEYGGDTSKILKYNNGQFVENISVANDSIVIKWIKQFYLANNTLFFTGTGNNIYRYNFSSFNIQTKEIKNLKSNIDAGHIFQTLEFNDRIYLITSEGVLSSSTN